MIHITDLNASLPVFKALSSEIRIQILELLTRYKQLNMNELAEKLNLTNGAVTMHVKKLEECGVIEVNTATGKHGIQKICYLHEDKLIVDLRKEISEDCIYEVEIGVGHYSSYQVFPTCGIATKDFLIGEVDEPRYFADPERINADILWFSRGFIEYRIPNYLKSGQSPRELQLYMELSSEAPGVCDDWPSDIFFHLNNIELGHWTSPGDFGDVKGMFTPTWWFPNWNQYGLLKLLAINNIGTFIDGLKISDITVNDLNINYKSDLIFRLSLPDTAKNIGGLTIYGRNFGNYNHGIKFRLIYEDQV